MKMFFKNSFALLIALTIVAPVYAQPMLTVSPAPTTDLAGFNTFTIGLTSAEPINGIDARFEGPLNQVNPFDLATPFNDFNLLFSVPVDNDSQFLFSSFAGAPNNPLVATPTVIESDMLLAAAFTNLTLIEAPFDPTDFDFAQLVIPEGQTVDVSLGLEINGRFVQLESIIAPPLTPALLISDPPPPGPIALSPGIPGCPLLPFNMGGSIVLSNANGAFEDLGEITLNISGSQIFMAELNGMNVDLGINDMIPFRQLAPGTIFTGQLIISSENGGSVIHDLFINCPEPASFALMSVAVLALAGFRRR